MTQSKNKNHVIVEYLCPGRQQLSSRTVRTRLSGTLYVQDNLSVIDQSLHSTYIRRWSTHLPVRKVDKQAIAAQRGRRPEPASPLPNVPSSPLFVRCWCWLLCPGPNTGDRVKPPLAELECRRGMGGGGEGRGEGELHKQRLGQLTQPKAGLCS